LSAPIFTDTNDRIWSMGSQVRAHWWAEKVASDLGPSYGEVSADGTVARIYAGGAEGWIVELDFGALSGVYPDSFNPSQIVVLDPAEGSTCRPTFGFPGTSPA